MRNQPDDSADVPEQILRQIKPLNTIADFKAIGCGGRTKAYELIDAGEIVAVKVGRSTRLTGESILAWLSRLPAVEPKNAA